jgi:hypothetical protein
MLNTIHLGFWDVALIVTVSLQGTVIAYLHEPKWKIVGLALPIPFTLGSLAVGDPVGSFHASGTVLLVLFAYAVLLLHYFARCPIVLSIALPAVGYCIGGAAMTKVLPQTEEAFWTIVTVGYVVGLVLYGLVPFREEPGHRTPLPIWIKLPAIMMVVATIVAIKQSLRGFMAMFPMVSVITCYEARKSLWTVCRYISIIVMAVACLMSTVRVLQSFVDLGWALAGGWAAYLAMAVPLLKHQWRNEG